MKFTHFAVTLAAASALGASAAGADPIATPGVIASLSHVVTIGSTVDPLNGDVNPYGLAISPSSAGKIAAGDLVVCNFNDKLNIQGLGTTIEVLEPVAGAKPKHLSGDPRLTGCAAIAMGDAQPWVAALDANDNPIVSATGQILSPLNEFKWQGPWGQAFVAGPKSPPAFYESNADDGSIVRINLAAKFTMIRSSGDLR